MMLFGQKIHPLNFEYAKRRSTKKGAVGVAGSTCRARITCAEITPQCVRLRFDNAAVAAKENYSDGVLEKLRKGRAVPARGGVFATGRWSVKMGAADFRVEFAGGSSLTTAAHGFGFNGEQAIFNFDVPDADGFYGFGERTKRLNKNGDSFDFYNVDVCAVFTHTFQRDDYDPAYVSIPFAIIRAGGKYTGLYIDNPDRLVFDAGQWTPGRLMCQSTGGNNDLYIINGPTLRDVVRNFTAITGRAEVPPVWSLGHHQCRWGYKTAAEFRGLKEKFRTFDLPVSALWYDIDYMDEYRVFTWDRVDIPNPAGLNAELKRAGIRSVAIVDPGVKLEPGYRIYDDGKKKDIFCKTLSGRDYVGRVWPGDTVFPDFPDESARRWWAGHLATFLNKSKLDGAWLDMNEPATGASCQDEMRFDKGKTPHSKYHNQYGHFMAKASRAAFEKNGGKDRPFLLTRSAFAGTQRYSAVWTGDNSSNWQHLRMSIPCTLNLGLSGVAFNGPDVGGFFGHTEEHLLTRWYQAGFLFPFFRNHSTNHTKDQEPWSFGPECLARIRDAIYTRYRLMPYLYNCFFEHYLTGDPVLRPLLYEFDDKAFENMDDQFMAGPNIMAAPIVTNGEIRQSIMKDGVMRHQRHVTLPRGWWFDLLANAWIEGGRTIPCEAGLDEVPVFIRDGAVIPYCNGKIRNSEMSFAEIELHIFSREKAAEYVYYVDDHETRNYRRGAYNKARIRAEVTGREAVVRIEETGGYKGKPPRFKPVFYGCDARRAVVKRNGAGRTITLKAATRRWVGVNVPVLA